MTEPTTIDDIPHPDERASSELRQLDAELAALDRIIANIERMKREGDGLASIRGALAAAGGAA